jgi:hypothetical protein
MTGKTQGGARRGRRVAPWAVALVLLGGAGRGRADEVAQDSAGASPDPRRTPWYLSGQAGTVVLGRSRNAATGWRLGRTFAAGAAFGRRWERFDAFVESEANGWSSTRPDGSRDRALAVDLGIGAGVSYAGGFLRTSLAAGLSILGIPTDVDRAGSTGIYVDLRPVGYRWPLARAWVVGVQPLSFTLAMPVLTGIPLIETQFRTSVTVEYGLR